MVAAGLWISRVAWPWIKALPWYAIAIAVLVAALVFQKSQARHWEKRAVQSETLIKGIRKAQADADKAAVVRQKKVAAGNAANSKETLHVLENDRAVALRAASTLRVRVADLERTARARALSRARGGPAGVAEKNDFRLSLSDELSLREQCEDVRINNNALIDWETRRLQVETQP